MRMAFGGIIARRFYHRKSSLTSSPVVSINNGTFYRYDQDSSTTGPEHVLFPNLSFTIQSSPLTAERWAVLGPAASGKTTFLQILRGQHLCRPSTARSFPFLASHEIIAKDPRLRNVQRAIQYVGFSSERGSYGQAGAKGSYMSARYESRREETDFSLLDHLRGNTNLNALEDHRNAMQKDDDDSQLAKVVADLRLESLVSMPMSNLSNGQTRRAMIAIALLGKPEFLLLDEPFIVGLDPANVSALSGLLATMVEQASPRLLLALRPQDHLPDWITHLVCLGPSLRVAQIGRREDVLRALKASLQLEPPATRLVGTGSSRKSVISRARSGGQKILSSQPSSSLGEVILEMSGVKVTYGEKTVLGNWVQNVQGTEKPGLWWRVRKGERWGIFGANGSGKTTVISLICSDHPQTYSLPITLFGRSRLPLPGRPGISIFDLQARMGHSSPEIHAFFPRRLSLRQTLESAWADTFISKPRVPNLSVSTIQACLQWFRADLDTQSQSTQTSHSSGCDTDVEWADRLKFGDLPFSSQRVALLLRAIVKTPELIILDEAFSGMDEPLRDKCMSFLDYGQTKRTRRAPDGTLVSEASENAEVSFQGLTEDQTMICISHVKDEVPFSVREWLRLPESDGLTPVKFGQFHEPLQHAWQWSEIWDTADGQGKAFQYQ